MGVRLHVTNGESVSSTLQRTSLGGAVLSWEDALHEGPVPEQPRAALLRTRAGFLSECGWGTRSAILSSLELRDRQLREAFDGGVPVVLWFEHDLYDQLQLLDVLALAHEAGAAPEAIVVDSFPGRPQTLGRSGRLKSRLRACRATRMSSPPSRAYRPTRLVFAASVPTTGESSATRSTAPLPR